MPEQGPTAPNRYIKPLRVLNGCLLVLGLALALTDNGPEVAKDKASTTPTTQPPAPAGDGNPTPEGDYAFRRRVASDLMQHPDNEEEVLRAAAKEIVCGTVSLHDAAEVLEHLEEWRHPVSGRQPQPSLTHSVDC